MPITLEDRCKALGYPSREAIRSLGAGAGLTFLCDSSGGQEVVVRFFPFHSTGDSTVDLADSISKRWNTVNFATGAWNTGSHNAESSSAEDRGPDLPTLLHEISLRWSLAESCGRSGLAPVIEFGDIEKHAFQVRPYFPTTLRDLVEKQVSPNPALLFHIIDEVWSSLQFLHQPEINQPHGNLTIANVSMGAGNPSEASVFLLDLKESPETKRAETKRLDYQNLGLIIYQLASSFEGSIDAVEARVRCRNAAWSHLGKLEGPWKKLCESLLDLDALPVGLDLGPMRREMLGPVMPPKGAFAPNRPLVAVTAEPPFRRDSGRNTEEAVASEADTDEIVRGHLAANDPLAALATAIAARCENAHKVALCDEIASVTPVASVAASADNRFLTLLEEAARIGSMLSALRLGEFLLERFPAEALPWLQAAADSGIHAAIPLLAHLFEWGGEGVERDPAKAVELYQAALEREDDPELLYRMAAAIIREPSLAGRQKEACQALEQAHQKGHYKATDLLAQCLSYGVGTEADEKRAFQLFTESWNRSKRVNQQYFTASNNLGVCFAIGFGTRRDPDRARHYFKQGEIGGHEASKKNLQTLIQTK